MTGIDSENNFSVCWRIASKNEDENDNFFDDLYDDDRFTIKRVQAKRSINSNAKKRGKINEILVWNY